MTMRKINLTLFSLFLAFLISLPIICVDEYLPRTDIPWQLVPFNADSLSLHYKERYPQLKPSPLTPTLQDSTKPLVLILIDGWGVPYKEKLLKNDFVHFVEQNTSFAIHKRLLQHSSHAENVEYRSGFADGILLENGDSSTCAINDGKYAAHFRQTQCCINCSDSLAVVTLDSLINEHSWKRIAWTAHEPREGDRNKLHSLLKAVSEITRKHPDVQFIIQGTHRPILGTPETRRMYLAPWVPAVFINCVPMESAVIRN